MNAKFVIVVLVALQVSLTLCDIPDPEVELVEKYNALKARFMSRLKNLGQLVQNAAAENEQAQAAKVALDGNEKVAVARAIMDGVAEEVGPMIDRLRSTVLGLYGAYLRPHIGEQLGAGISKVSELLDQVAPADE